MNRGRKRDSRGMKRRNLGAGEEGWYNYAYVHLQNPLQSLEIQRLGEDELREDFRIDGFFSRRWLFCRISDNRRVKSSHTIDECLTQSRDSPCEDRLQNLQNANEQNE